jgi:hypothetical protein
MLKQACPEEILNQVQNDTVRVQHDRMKIRGDLWKKIRKEIIKKW